MHGFTVFSAVSLPLVAAFIVPRVSQPDNWSASLEKWTTYHARYIQLGCDENHTTDFFEECCHPLQANQGPSDLPSQCHPGNNVVNNGNNVVKNGNNGVNNGNNDVNNGNNDVNNGNNDDDDNCNDDGDNPAEARPTTATSTQSAATPTASDGDEDCDDEDDNPPTATPTTLAPSTNPVTNGFMTYFYQKGIAGACGTVYPDSAIICSLNAELFAAEKCGRKVRVFNPTNNKSVTATVAGKCSDCKSNYIDLSTGAFSQLAALELGVVNVLYNLVQV